MTRRIRVVIVAFTACLAMLTAMPAASADKDQTGPVDLAVIGDVPYGEDSLALMPVLSEAINEEDLDAVVHVGDYKAGNQECTDALADAVLAEFNSFDDPLIYTPGDNEWTDCHRANNGSYNPIERLEGIRDRFFSAPLGGGELKTKSRGQYPENQLWDEAGVTFATLHVVGSNNGLAPWFGGDETPEQTESRISEWSNRNDANIKWLKKAFTTAKKSSGLVLFLHADMWNVEDRADGDSFDGHQEFVARLAELAEDFDGPVLILSGDSHNFRVDDVVDWSLFGIDGPSNVTQIIVDRTIEDDIVWLRLTIDSNSEDVFTWEEVTVPVPAVG